MSHELHPSILEHLGLVAAVRSHCDEVDRRGDIHVRFDPVRPPGQIGPEAALCLYRVVQEGVRNASKHSGAALVRVTLESSPESADLTILDDGCGFDPEARTSGGLGLVSMTERVRALGGEFCVTSKPGEGTRLHVRLPTHRQEGGPIRDRSSTQEISHA